MQGRVGDRKEKEIERFDRAWYIDLPSQLQLQCHLLITLYPPNQELRYLSRSLSQTKSKWRARFQREREKKQIQKKKKERKYRTCQKFLNMSKKIPRWLRKSMAILRDLSFELLIGLVNFSSSKKEKQKILPRKSIVDFWGNFWSTLYNKTKRARAKQNWSGRVALKRKRKRNYRD